MGLAERRETFIQEVAELLNEALWVKALARVIIEGPSMGRSPRWQRACEWHVVHLADNTLPVEWVACQGHVMLVHANA